MNTPLPLASATQVTAIDTKELNKSYYSREWPSHRIIDWKPKPSFETAQRDLTWLPQRSADSAVHAMEQILSEERGTF